MFTTTTTTTTTTKNSTHQAGTFIVDLQCDNTQIDYF